MMSRMTASNDCVPMTSRASRPPGHFTGSIPSMRSRVSTSSAMMGWSSTIRMRGFPSDSPMALGLLVTPALAARQSSATRSLVPRIDEDVLRVHAGRDQPVEEFRAEPGRAELSRHSAVRSDPGLHVLEEVLDLDLLAFHPDDLADLRD